MPIKRVNMNVPEELLERIDAYAKENYSTRSSVMNQACNQFLMAQDFRKLVAQMNGVLKRISETETVDDETMQKLEEFETLCKLLSASSTSLF